MEPWLFSSGAGVHRRPPIPGPSRRPCLTALAAALPLLGCTAIVPTHYKEIKGWKVASPHDDFVNGQWWKPLGDRELDRLEAEVSVSNQTLEGRRAIAARQCSPLRAFAPPHPEVNCENSVEPMPTMTASTSTLTPEVATAPSTRSAAKAVLPKRPKEISTKPASVVS